MVLLRQVDKSFKKSWKNIQWFYEPSLKG